MLMGFWRELGRFWFSLEFELVCAGGGFFFSPSPPPWPPLPRTARERGSFMISGWLGVLGCDLLLLLFSILFLGFRLYLLGRCCVLFLLFVCRTCFSF